MRKKLSLIIVTFSFFILAANGFATATSQTFPVNAPMVGDAGRVALPGLPILDPALTANGPKQGSALLDLGSNLDINAQNAILGWDTGGAKDIVYDQLYIPVPEPGTLLLLGAGAFGLACYGKRRQNG